MALSNLKILIADDHKLFAEGLTYLLKQELPIESIDTVYNGKSAIGKVLNTDYDIIIMDVNMPLLNGIETCAAIKKLLLWVPIKCRQSLTTATVPPALFLVMVVVLYY